MENKLVLITGGTGGIGLETAKGLIARGAAVVIVGRDPSRGEAAVRAIHDATGRDGASFLRADLSSEEDTRRLAAAFRARFDRLDVLVNNAGAVFWKRRESVDGREMTLALNHLGYFHLTHLLLPLLLESAPARIVNVSSDAHRGGRIHFDDLEQARGYSAWRAYSQSKLANILFTRELARRLAGMGVTVNALHPGFVATGFGRASGLGRLVMPLAHRFAVSPEAGARTPIYLAASPAVEGVTGRYFANEQETRAADAAYDDAVASRLWERSAAIVGLRDPYGGLPLPVA